VILQIDSDKPLEIRVPPSVSVSKGSKKPNSPKSQPVKKEKKILKLPESTEEIIYFSSPNEAFGCFSINFKIPFQLEDFTWLCIDQYLSAQKYKGTEWESKIKAFKHPAKLIQIYQIIPEDDISEDWEDERETLMFEANLAKFQQNESLKDYLLQTGEKKLVFFDEDELWGSGTDQDGQNLLGNILGQVRDRLLKDASMGRS